MDPLQIKDIKTLKILPFYQPAESFEQEQLTLIFVSTSKGTMSDHPPVSRFMVVPDLGISAEAILHNFFGTT